MSESFWTEERTNRLRDLCALGWTDTRMQADLGASTRNMIIGKIHRLGLRDTIPGQEKRKEQKKETSSPLPQPSVASKPRWKIAVALSPSIELPTAPSPEITELEPEGWRERRISLLDAGPTHCRWPAADDGGASMVCGALKPREGTSYCPRHERISRGSHA